MEIKTEKYSVEFEPKGDNEPTSYINDTKHLGLDINNADCVMSLKPDVVIQAPARINLINPLDAVEGDFWMPSVAINGLDNPLSAFLYIKKINEESRLKIYTMKKLILKWSVECNYEEKLSKSRNEIRNKLKGKNKIIYANR